MTPTTPITALYAGLLALLILGLAARVSLGRERHRVGLGDGGHRSLERRIRTHANAVENLPLALVLMLVAELNGATALWLHGAGIGLIAGRLLHAWGLSRSSGQTFGRFVGTSLTW
ncbi:MAG: MAPEG family protein, partial [Gammaproteobacteria bacterium]